MNYNFTPTRQTQDWQLDSIERKYRHNSISRHQHVINEMEYQPVQHGVNMSLKRG